MKKIILVFLLYIFSLGIVPAEPIRLATTTSTENSGLLKVLIPHFEKQTGNVVHVLSVGTGHALRLGQDGNVDVVLVHAPKAELRFVPQKAGIYYPEGSPLWFLGLQIGKPGFIYVKD